MSEEKSLSEHAAEILGKLEASFNDLKSELEKLALEPTIEITDDLLPLPRTREFLRNRPCRGLDPIMEDNASSSRSHQVNLADNASLPQTRDCVSNMEESTSVDFFSCPPSQDCAGYVPKEEREMEAGDISNGNRLADQLNKDEKRGCRKKSYYSKAERKLEAGDISNGNNSRDKPNDGEKKGCRKKNYVPKAEKKVKASKTSRGRKPWNKSEDEEQCSSEKLSKKSEW